MAEILGPCHCSHGPSFQSPRRPKKCPICPLSREQTPTAPKAHCSENTHSHWSCYFNSDYRHHLWCWICRGCHKSCLCPYAKQHTRTLTQESMGKILQGVSIFRTMVLRSSQLFFSFQDNMLLDKWAFSPVGHFLDCWGLRIIGYQSHGQSQKYWSEGSSQKFCKKEGRLCVHCEKC